MSASVDFAILALDRALRTLAGVASTQRPVPGDGLDSSVAQSDRQHIAGLMRVNHSGEVCAQALYQGQALFARDPRLADSLRKAADEEVEHLAWTATRIGELGGRVSVFSPLWYAGALAIGSGAAILGDEWSLGFLRETERQVVDHLSGHLDRIPLADTRTRAIVEQMRDDEAQHAQLAETLGAKSLPEPVCRMMRITARLMTEIAYLG